ncbi:ALF repeat-containing protein [Streptomyces sp. SA15]|uniref:ALF repeat-containing protein n=1 Tax=Streptomyces sp. SA15 TaxID=934019 RepID=UPI0015CCB0BD|nr:ALF repeat-containing protein [Streptomyces sp. SA15]
MRPTRTTLLVAATALAPALLFTTPAFAEAIDGTPEELRYFLEVGRYEVDG